MMDHESISASILSSVVQKSIDVKTKTKTIKHTTCNGEFKFPFVRPLLLVVKLMSSKLINTKYYLNFIKLLYSNEIYPVQQIKLKYFNKVTNIYPIY